jgi:hypothetical protein
MASCPKMWPPPLQAFQGEVEPGSRNSPWRNSTETDTAMRPRSVRRHPRVVAAPGWCDDARFDLAVDIAARATGARDGADPATSSPTRAEPRAGRSRTRRRSLILSGLRDSYRFSSRTTSHWLAGPRTQYTKRPFAIVRAIGAECDVVSRVKTVACAFDRWRTRTSTR